MLKINQVNKMIKPLSLLSTANEQDDKNKNLFLFLLAYKDKQRKKLRKLNNYIHLNNVEKQKSRIVGKTIFE